MPKTIEVTIYEFDELNDKAKEKARSHYCDHWMGDHWSESAIESAKQDGHHKHGFRVDEIRFRGFWSQGDGASWCGAVDLKEWIEKTFNTTDKEHPLTQIVLALLDEGWIENKIMVSYSTSHYCHENTMDVASIDHYYAIDDGSVMEMGMFKGANVYDLIQMLNGNEGTIATLQERLTNDCKDFAREIYNQLEEDYESETSDERIAANYDANEVYFYETGAIA